MKHAAAMLALALLATGCAMHPPAPPAEMPPAPMSRDYDLLWDATLKAVERHFDLFVQRKDQGTMMSTYKIGEPLPGGSLARDAQTLYDAEEDLLHITRRQLTARISEDFPGVYAVHLEVIRERQGYAPPPSEQTYGTGYDLYNTKKTGLREAADQGATVTWYRLGRDLYLEKAIINRIQADVDRRGGQVTEPPPAPAPEELPPLEEEPAPESNGVPAE